MIALQQGLKSKFTSASLASTITGGWHYGEVTAGTAFPYLVGNIISAPASPSYATDAPGEYDVQFSLIGTSLNTLGGLVAAAETAFNAKLTLSGATCTSYFQTQKPLAMRQPAGELGAVDAGVSHVWAYHWTVRYTVQ